jgi:3-hydroxy-9,10-secoandrosta-1,3,5(10)-triene-9,17-dione monooxygenase
MWTDAADLSEAIRTQVAEVGDNFKQLGAGQDDSAQVVAALADSQLTQLMVPTELGGLGGSFQDLVNTACSLGRISGSGAWLLTHYGIHSGLLSQFEPAVGESIYATEAPRLALATSPEAVARNATDSGVLVSGTWRWVTGATHANWLLLCHAGDVMLVPRSALQGTPINQLGGLRGVGFEDLVAAEVEVVESHVIDQEKLFAGVTYAQNAQLGSILGCAQGGYEEYRQITSQWVGGIAGDKVAELTQVQSRLGHTHTELTVAALLLERLLNQLDESPPTVIAGERVYIAGLCRDAVARLVRQMGARGLFDQNPLQRRYRDLRAMVAHDEFHWQRNMAALGRQQLGVLDG